MAIVDETGRRRGDGRAALIFGAAVLVLWAGAGVLLGLAHQLTLGHLGAAAGLPVFGLTGVVVAYHQPRNPVGWILICFPFLFLLGVDAQYYAVLRYHLGHSGLPFGPVAVLVAPVTQPSLFVLPLAILLFPDGRVTSARWRWVLPVYAVLGAILAVGEFGPAVDAVAAHDIRVDATGNVANPPGLPGWLAHPSAGLLAFVLASIGVIWLSFVAHQVLSWRQADGVHRQQLKWLASGAAVTVACGVLSSTLSSSASAMTIDTSMPVPRRLLIPAGLSR